MKKTIFALLFFTVSFTVSAQTGTQAFVEVKNVETRWEQYQDDGKNYYGVIFSNKNSFPVTIEAEIWRNHSFSGGIIPLITNTKSFVLKAGDEYTWKIGLSYYSGHDGGVLGSSNYYYIKFKAYK